MLGNTYEYLPVAVPEVVGPVLRTTSFCESQDAAVRETTCGDDSTLVQS